MGAPVGNEPGMIDSITDVAQHWLPLPTLALLGGLLWRSSARVAQFEREQNEHAAKLIEHAAKIDALERADSDARVVVARLPTKDDLRAQTEQLQHQMQAGFDTMARMIVGNRD